MAVIEFLNLGATYSMLREEIDEAVGRVLAGGQYILGPEVEAFEAEFAAYVGAKYCVSVGNGLEALTLSLRAMGVGPGDEVIVPSNTYIATWLAVTHVGATVVPVEPDERTYNLDPKLLTRAISPKTRVILPVHLYGQPVDIDGVLAAAKEHGLMVLEDAAQAHGARWRGRRIGAFGLATTWSFYPTKNLGAFGDGGAVTTDEESLANDLRMLRNYGSKQKYHNETIGWNSRLDPVQAAILRVKLRHLDDWNDRRREQAATYIDRLDSCSWINLPCKLPDAEHVWHVFVVQAKNRDALQSHLRECGVGTLIHYPVAPHLQPAYQGLGLGTGSLPISERLHAQVLSLPIGPHLRPMETTAVCDAIVHFLESQPT
jgi:dTDP-4-amino-4,6-dideoxygalactose transaminase